MGRCLGRYFLIFTLLIWRRLSQNMACLYTNVLMTASQSDATSSLSNTASQCVDSISNWIHSNLQLNADKMQLMWCSSSRKLTQSPTYSFSVAGSLVCPINAVRHLTTILVRSHIFGELCHAALLHFVTFVHASPTTASGPWWCRLYAQDSTTATSSWSDFQHIYSGASSQFLTLRLVWCSDLVATIMSRTLLQLYIGCVYHNVSTSRWLSWRSVCCMVLHRHT